MVNSQTMLQRQSQWCRARWRLTIHDVPSHGVHRLLSPMRQEPPSISHLNDDLKCVDHRLEYPLRNRKWRSGRVVALSQTSSSWLHKKYGDKHRQDDSNNRPNNKSNQNLDEKIRFQSPKGKHAFSCASEQRLEQFASITVPIKRKTNSAIWVLGYLYRKRIP
jgi:hypothetical protein